MNFLKQQSIKYLFAGCTNTIVAFGTYASILHFTDLKYWVANFFSVSVSTVLGFYLSSEFVFRNNQVVRKNAKFKYACTLLAQYLISTFIIWLFIKLGLSEMWAYTGMLPIAVVFSFVLQKFWVFKDSYSSSYSQ